ncbi:hypothetical protein GTO91_02975 [Heliobacterium undosum]|uniref:Uncharacterized protein n=1 Tax=Heliomicrobium undosum TaxID=121734 RepID=A0A845KY46_9FIRM|nr:hypothetical protein [Heliomicrobium undosum]MZP28682.1 hypothetical protein [Heliomicrobium undosum]
MNSLLTLQPFSLIYDGVQKDGKTGSGIAEFDCASYDHAIRFTAANTTEVARVELELARHGSGADVIIEIRSGLAANGNSDGTTLKRSILPKEFLPEARGYFSIPVDLTGLTAGAIYWLVILRGGNAVDHFHLHGETGLDAAYPSYRRLNPGAWEEESAVHFKMFAGESGELKHGVYGTGYTTLEYAGEMVSRVYRYLPPIDGHAGGIRDTVSYAWVGEYLKRGGTG